MELDKNNHIDKLMRERVKESEFYYASEAESAKSIIWDAIEQDQDQEKFILAPTVSLWPTLAKVAAAIALLVVSSLIYLKIHDKNAEIADLKIQMEELKKSTENKDLVLREQAITQVNDSVNPNLQVARVIRDTIYITKIKEVYKIQEETIVNPSSELIALVTPIAPDYKIEKQIINRNEVFIRRQFVFENSLPVANQPNKDLKNQGGIKFKIGNPAGSESESKILSFNIKL
jgi:cellulose biosynthesis protein BcsQ